MLTKKRIKVPIYNITIDVCIYDKIEELKGSIPDEELNNPFLGLTCSNGSNYIVVCVNSKSKSTIVHEVEHTKNEIWSIIGHTPQRNNDEPDAYLVTYLYERIVQIFDKHTK